jgi:fatty acid desaturase
MASAATTEIYFCNSVKQLKRIGRSQLAPAMLREIRTCHAADLRRNLPLILFPLLWVIGAGLVRGRTSVSVVGYLFMGLAALGLSAVLHEASHNLVFKSPRLNWLIGVAAGLPCLLSVSAYRALHLAHHAHERSDRDPDDIELHQKDGRLLRAIYVGFAILGTYLYLPHVALQGFRLARRSKRRLILAEYGVSVGAICLAGRVLGTAWLTHFWLIPLIIASQITSLRGLAEHGMTTAGNPFTASRTVVSTRVVSVLLLNLNYHLEHHLFPGVPWYNLPRVHRILLPEYRLVGASVYPGYARYFLDFARALCAPVRSNVRLLPPNLRDALCG